MKSKCFPIICKIPLIWYYSIFGWEALQSLQSGDYSFSPELASMKWNHNYANVTILSKITAKQAFSVLFKAFHSSGKLCLSSFCISLCIMSSVIKRKTEAVEFAYVIDELIVCIYNQFTAIHTIAYMNIRECPTGNMKPLLNVKLSVSCLGKPIFYSRRIGKFISRHTSINFW